MFLLRSFLLSRRTYYTNLYFSLCYHKRHKYVLLDLLPRTSLRTPQYVSLLFFPYEVYLLLYFNVHDTVEQSKMNHRLLLLLFCVCEGSTQVAALKQEYKRCTEKEYKYIHLVKVRHSHTHTNTQNTS